VGVGKFGERRTWQRRMGQRVPEYISNCPRLRFKDVDCVNRDQNQVQAMNQIRNPHPREDDHIEVEEVGN
jgi:hypothetical protein